MLRIQLIFLALLAPFGLHAQSSYACLAPNAASQFVLAALKNVVSRTDSLGVAARAKMQLPAGDTSIVQTVSDSTVCAQAAAGAATAFPAVQNSTGGYVFKIGTSRFYVVDPNATKNKRLWGIVLDQNFAVLVSDPIN